jgi:hypothetical protein
MRLSQCCARGHIDEPVRAVPLGLAKANATIIVIMEADVRTLELASVGTLRLIEYFAES